MTSMANLTAIYNTACFFAYLFSILLLREKIVANKVLAVFLSLAGVAVISLTTRGSGDGKSVDGKQAYSIAGDVLALVGAALYGFEEVNLIIMESGLTTYLQCHCQIIKFWMRKP